MLNMKNLIENNNSNLNKEISSRVIKISEKIENDLKDINKILIDNKNAMESKIKDN